VIDHRRELSLIEALSGADTGTITFAWRRTEDGETTAAWITADADLVVSGSEMR